MSEATVSQSPKLLRRLLRAKDRMDAAPAQDWSAWRPARASWEPR